ncbi:MAG: hypothetical protein M1436_04450 [Acidobacteria bacterium]|nr:hypothetical protein [Acidobacteriota bacterium]
MPSVEASWSGQCRDQAAQRELTRQLARIGRISHLYFDSPPPLQAYNEPVEGRILMSPSVFRKDTAPSHLPASPDGAYIIHRVRLYGVEFRLFDPRNIDFPSPDRLSFVFLRHNDPVLDGRVVMVEPKQECSLYRSEDIRAADWYLAHPSITLRYLFERWIDRLMACVKTFYFPELRYWRYLDGPCDALLRQFRGTCPDAAFAALEREFHEELQGLPNAPPAAPWTM